MNFEEAFAEFQSLLARLDDPRLAGEERIQVERRVEGMREWFRSQQVDDARPLVELESELAALEARIEAAEGEKVKRTKTRFVGAERTIGGGIEPHEINEMLDRANRLEELLERADRLRTAIERKRS